MRRISGSRLTIRGRALQAGPAVNWGRAKFLLDPNLEAHAHHVGRPASAAPHEVCAKLRSIDQRML